MRSSWEYECCQIHGTETIVCKRPPEPCLDVPTTVGFPACPWSCQLLQHSRSALEREVGLPSICWVLSSNQAKVRTESVTQTNSQSQQQPLTGSKLSSAHPAARGMFPGQLQSQHQWGEVWHQTTTFCGLLWHSEEKARKEKENNWFSILSSKISFLFFLSLLPKLNFSDIQVGNLLLLYH